MPKLQKKPSALKRGHPTLQNMKFFNFFLLLWVIFALLDPDSESGSGSTDPIESGSATLHKTGRKKVYALMIICSLAYDWYERGEGSAGWSAQPQHPSHQVTGQSTVLLHHGCKM
jgi:hypothetical protein